jgi:hypothetical protein
MHRICGDFHNVQLAVIYDGATLHAVPNDAPPSLDTLITR